MFDPKKYPSNWKEIRARMLERAQHRCEECGVPNYTVGTRGNHGGFAVYSTHARYSSARTEAQIATMEAKIAGERVRYIVIVLTIAHLNHNPMDNDETNLKVLCQFDHLILDKYQHRINAQKTRQRNKYGDAEDLF